MEGNTDHLDSKFKILTIVYWIIGVTPITVSVVCYALVESGSVVLAEKRDNDFLIYLPFLLAVLAIPMSNFLFKNLIGKIGESSNPLATYQTANVIRAAIMEGPGLFAAVVILLTGRIELLAVSVAMLIFYYLNRPTRQNFESLRRQGDLNS